MVDSIAVLNPGWRALDDNGDPFSDAVLSFFNAGTSDERTVYSDSDLSTSLGSTVDCDSAGTPISSVNNPTLIYTGSTEYKLTISSATAGFSRTFDNVLGALDTSSFLTEAAVADRSVVTTSSNRAVTVADKGKIIDVTCSGGDITLTFDDAATLGDGFYVSVRHNGTANQVPITGDGSDTFGIPGANVTGFSLTGRGQGCTITCDATNFKTDAWTAPLISGNTGVILVADRLSTPPGSPEAGARYIVGSSPTGAWSGFAEYDIAEADGFGNWFNYTPATDAGWIAYVQDEDTHYAFRGTAWGVLLTAASDTVAGAVEYAVQSEMESAASNVLAVTPGRQHFHPGHPKAQVQFNGTGTVAIGQDYGVSSISDNSTGNYNVNFDTAFSAANYAVTGFSGGTGTTTRNLVTSNASSTKSTTAQGVIASRSDTGTDTDMADIGVIVCGDQ